MRPILDKEGLDCNPHQFGRNWYYEEREGLAIYHETAGRVGVIRWNQIRAALRRKDGKATR